MRIVSLLPSTTEIICALGREDALAGRSHECDFPSSVRKLPACTEPKFDPDGTSYELDQRVKALLQEGLSVYRVNADQLKDLKPDVIITQDHCEVCAASSDEVKAAVHEKLGHSVKVIPVSPTNIHEVLDSIQVIGNAIDAKEKAEDLAHSMKLKLKSFEEKTLNLQMPEILCLEWLDPLMSAGNWMPELIQLAGGYPLAGQAGEHSPSIEWTRIRTLDPKIIVITPCGYSIEETLREISNLASWKGWSDLRAVRNKQVFVADGNQYFNRPGPRLVDSTAILAEIIHPSLFRTPGNHHTGWINLFERQANPRKNLLDESAFFQEH